MICSGYFQLDVQAKCRKTNKQENTSAVLIDKTHTHKMSRTVTKAHRIRSQNGLAGFDGHAEQKDKDVTRNFRHTE